MDLIVAFTAGSAFFCLCLILVGGPFGKTRKPYERAVTWLSREESPKKKRRRRSLFRGEDMPGWKSIIGKALISAGIPLEPQEGLAIWALLIVILPLLLGIARGPWGATVGLVLALLLPVIVVRVKATSRLNRLEKQLPELLELLAAGLRAGFSLTQGLQHAAAQVADPLGSSLQLINVEMAMGLDVEVALKRWQERLGSMDAEMVVSAILIQREVGGNLAELLDNISRLMRDRQQAQMEMKTLTAQGKMEGIVISLLPLVLGVAISILNPHYLDPLFYTPGGRALLGIAVGQGLIGMFLMYRITQVRF